MKAALAVTMLIVTAGCTYTPSEIRAFPSKLTGHSSLAPQQAANCVAAEMADKSSFSFATPRPTVQQGKAPGAVDVALYAGNFLSEVIDFNAVGAGSSINARFAPNNLGQHVWLDWTEEAIKSCDQNAKVQRSS